MDRWRPHVKTCKVPEVLALLLQAGVRRFKCATTREADVLLQTATDARCGPIDVLVAMSTHGANLERATNLAAAHQAHRLSMLTEEPQHAAALHTRRLGVFVDLDPGYHRTGIPLPERERIAAVARAAGPGSARPALLRRPPARRHDGRARGVGPCDLPRLRRGSARARGAR
jgi:D-serine deaminase-like pyridoxal phosphate-dependent protein